MNRVYKAFNVVMGGLWIAGYLLLFVMAIISDVLT